MKVSVAAIAFAAMWGLMYPQKTVAQEAVSGFELAGDWTGSLSVQGMELPIVFHFLPGEAGTLSGSIDSPAQGAEGIQISEITVSGDTLVVEVSSIGGRYRAVWDGERIAGEWSQSGTTLPLDLTRLPEGKPAAAFVRPQHPAEPFPYESEQVQFDNAAADIVLAGTLTLPVDAGTHPAAILISGSGPQDRDETILGHKPFLVLADHLTRMGVAVLRFDDRGIGQSSGVFSTATSEDFATDVRAAVEYLAGRPEIDAAAIGLIGHSEGGLIAPMVAAQSEQVAFVVLMAGPGTPGDRILLDQGELIARASGVREDVVEITRTQQKAALEAVKQGAEPAELEALLLEQAREQLAVLTDEEKTKLGVETDSAVENRVRVQASAVATPWFRYFLAYDPLPALRQVRVPVLAMNGELDLQVPYEVNLSRIEKALAKSGNPDVTIVSLPGHNHLFQQAVTGLPAEYGQIEQTMSPEALDLISSWILERVR